MADFRLLHTITGTPKASMETVQAALATLKTAWQERGGAGDALKDTVASQLGAVLAHSPYLLQLACKYPVEVLALLHTGPKKTLQDIHAEHLSAPSASAADLMHHLRRAKGKSALVIGLSDCLGIWRLEETTLALSRLADTCLSLACDFLLRKGVEKKEIAIANVDNPSAGSGLIVLGMGKLGGCELNYSSDIDLIILFDKDKINYTGKHSPQHFFSKLAQELVRLLQERTSEGYVFRTDLRLRPDPASTPAANSVNAAFTYYETVGQNWERAALIKARPVAGDIPAGEEFLTQLRSFIWRKHLDFAAIADIQSIRRQMNARTGTRIDIEGHNIKLGAGGIREIEFYTQIHQLIWGGRRPSLQKRGTCETLDLLAKEGLVEKAVTDRLVEAYRLYRKIEHRLQMVADAQTHSLPKQSAPLENIALFCGFNNLTVFREVLHENLEFVHRIYSESFRGPQALSNEGNLVFTGVDHDPATLETISGMGFENAEAVSFCIQGWHRGSKRATRTKRARELITELTPALLKAFSTTVQPDQAFLRFDQFLTGLPAGVQLFSLFQMNPQLLSLIADIMGNAPALADSLSKHPQLFDAVLTGDFYAPLGGKEKLASQLKALLAPSQHIEDVLAALATFKMEKQFKAGIQFLKHQSSVLEVQHYLSDIAECVLEALIEAALKEFSHSYGNIEGAHFTVLALGRLGAREVTFGSDLDLVFLYDAPDAERRSSGTRGFPASVYYARFAQRLITLLTSPGPQGKLYELDMRLRPSGKDGPLAVSIEAFDSYFTESAWVFERMALTKGRPIASDKESAKKITRITAARARQPADEKKLAGEVQEMRERVTKEFGTSNVWDVKHARGGLMDIDFLIEYLILRHGHAHPDILAASSSEAVKHLVKAKLLAQNDGELLIETVAMQNTLLAAFRLCHNGSFDEANAPAGLANLLCEFFNIPDLAALKTALVQNQQRVYSLFRSFISPH